MQALDNAPIKIKTMIAPLFCCVMAIIIGVVFYITSVQLSTAMKDSAWAAQTISYLNEAKANLSDAHAVFYKVVSWKHSGAIAEPKITEELTQAQEFLQKTQYLLQAVDYERIGVDPKDVAMMNEHFAAYNSSADQTSNIIDDDVTMADIFLNDCQTHFDPTRTMMVGIIGQLEKKADSAKVAQESSVTFGLKAVLVCVLLTVVLGILVSLLIGRAIANPIRGITSVMQSLAGGDKGVDVPHRDRHDEVGDMARTVEIFKDNMIRNEKLEAEQAKERTERERRASNLEKLVADFQKNITGVVGIVSAAAGQMQTTAQSMSAIAEDTTRQANSVAASAQEASSNVQTVASASEELHSSITEIGHQVSESSKLSEAAVAEVKRTNETVESLATAAQKIGQVVGLINDIASQTNLLALNATIEAARAGDAGKGFAVVAQEVKSLANQTAKATEEIAAQVNEMQTVTTGTVTAIREIGTTIARLNEIATAIASSVEEQTAATNEIARNVEQTASGTQAVSTSIVKVTESSNQTGVAAGQVLEAGNELANQGEKLRQVVENFIEKVRTA